MITVRVHAETTLSAGRVLEAAHDFSPVRTTVWPAVADEYFEVHAVNELSADVTEGSKSGPLLGWERCDYDWSRPGVVIATVTDSNLYRAGSTWEITATDSAGRTSVDMTWRRRFKPGLGWVVAIVYRTLGRTLLGSDARKMLRNLERLGESALR